MEESGRRAVCAELDLAGAHGAAIRIRVSGASIALITGPNMGGKSTYLRQAALLVVMAQCGCFVPAERMRLGLVDRIYTRIGASDNVARGRSTFMVEMTETAAILNTATAQSLVLLDEMGRGTATYDGLSLAWATVEYLHDRIGARTLFATHYHELTLLEERLARLKNLRVTVKETAGGIVFLHTVEAGAASKSYGIEVARLAGLPVGVIARAREVLKLHERAETQQVARALEAADESDATPADDDVYAAFAEDCGPAGGGGCGWADAAGGAESAGGVAAGVGSWSCVRCRFSNGEGDGGGGGDERDFGGWGGCGGVPDWAGDAGG